MHRLTRLAVREDEPGGHLTECGTCFVYETAYIDYGLVPRQIKASSEVTCCCPTAWHAVAVETQHKHRSLPGARYTALMMY